MSTEAVWVCVEPEPPEATVMPVVLLLITGATEDDVVVVELPP